MSSSGTLGQPVPEILVPSRAHRLNPTPVPWAEPSPCDCYDQRLTSGMAQCTDSTGRRRRKHEYTVETRRGVRCLFCWKVRPWESA
jgi:hypothetical protein